MFAVCGFAHELYCLHSSMGQFVSSVREVWQVVMFYSYAIRAQVQCVGYAVVEVCLSNLIRNNDQ